MDHRSNWEHMFRDLWLEGTGRIIGRAVRRVRQMRDAFVKGVVSGSGKEEIIP